DSVLDMVVTEYLYTHYPDAEGILTNLRSAIVNFRNLGRIARQLGLDSYLMMARGEVQNNGRAREVILANCIEAVIGAIYLDSGFRIAETFIRDKILVELPKIIAEGKDVSVKSKLQEMIQSELAVTPTYKVLAQDGPDHDKTFLVSVMVGERPIGFGKGASKQEAEFSAAKDALGGNTWRSFPLP
ncbi:MAG: ribonuclease III, partial [Candidatus Doudnabacteria bacterium Gr01-1014_77]